ncbi:MAG: aminotransferase class IV [Desulfotalea sp.]
MDIYYINNKFIEEDQANISIKDLSVLRGYGVFDFLISYNGKPFHLKRHIARLAKSAKLIDLELPESEKEIYKLTLECIKRNSHSEFNVRILVTGGTSNNNYLPEDGASNLIIMVTALPAVPKSYYTDGIKVITYNTERLIPGAKSINYIPSIMAMKEATSQNAIEAILIDRNGYIQEGTTSNFFAVIDDKLVTPPCDRILPGITREIVLNLVKKEIDVEVRPIHSEEIKVMSEAFVSASNKEILPINAINSISLDVNAGKITKKVFALFAKYTKSHAA